MGSFENIIQKYRNISFSERDKGYRFEKLMREYLKSDPLYAAQWSDIWLWSEFPSRHDFAGKDIGIDLVARTVYGDYWAVQCKCLKEDTRIDKPVVDTFLSTSGKSFYDVHEPGKKVRFSCRPWLDTTLAGFNSEAEHTIRDQTPEVKRRGYYDLAEAPVDWARLDKGVSGEAAVKISRYRKTGLPYSERCPLPFQRGRRSLPFLLKLQTTMRSVYPGGLNAILACVSTSDPNVRSAAVAAWGHFSATLLTNPYLWGLGKV